MNFLQRFLTVCAFLFCFNSYTANILAQFPWDKIAPVAIASLSSCFASLKLKNIDDKSCLDLIKKIDQGKGKSDLRNYAKNNFLLSEVYQKLFPINDLCLKSPEYWEVVNTGRMDLLNFNNTMWQAYKCLKEGDFVSARKYIWPWIGTTTGRSCAIDRLFSSFNAVAYNDYNILKDLEQDPIWMSLSKKQKLEIAHNKNLRSAMNLELVLRAELLKKLQIELNINNLNYKGLRPFLFSLMAMSSTKKIKVLLSLNPAEKLWPAFYNNQTYTLKAFHKTSFATCHQLPLFTNNLHRDLYIKRINELIYYNQDCKNNTLFTKAANAIAAGAKGNIYYMHLLFDSISPSNIDDFVNEVDLIKAYLQEQKDKLKPPLDSENQDGKGDPNDPKHQKEVMSFLLVAQEKSEELIDVINNKLAEYSSEIRIKAIDLYHTFHGHLKGSKPTGLHLLWRRCCFEIQKIRYFGNNMHSTCKVTKNNFTKNCSTLFPNNWSPEKVINKLIIWIKSSKVEIFKDANIPNIRIIKIIKKCCGDTINFRTKIYGSNSFIESFYPEANTLFKKIETIKKCLCMK